MAKADSWSRFISPSRYSARSFGLTAPSLRRCLTTAAVTPNRAAISSALRPSSPCSLAKASYWSAGVAGRSVYALFDRECLRPRPRGSFLHKKTRQRPRPRSRRPPHSATAAELHHDPASESPAPPAPPRLDSARRPLPPQHPPGDSISAPRARVKQKTPG
jgi:hypothetical protein